MTFTASLRAPANVAVLSTICCLRVHEAQRVTVGQREVADSDPVDNASHGRGCRRKRRVQIRSHLDAFADAGDLQCEIVDLRRHFQHQIVIDERLEISAVRQSAGTVPAEHLEIGTPRPRCCRVVNFTPVWVFSSVSARSRQQSPVGSTTIPLNVAFVPCAMAGPDPKKARHTKVRNIDPLIRHCPFRLIRPLRYVVLSCESAH